MELATLREIGVSTSGVVIDHQADTGIAIIMVDDNKENTILVVMGANDHLTEQAVLRSLEDHWDSLDAILVNYEIPQEVVGAALAEASRRGVPSVLDAGPPRKLRAPDLAPRHRGLAQSCRGRGARRPPTGDGRRISSTRPARSWRRAPGR